MLPDVFLGNTAAFEKSDQGLQRMGKQPSYREGSLGSGYENLLGVLGGGPPKIINTYCLSSHPTLDVSNRAIRITDRAIRNS